MPLTHTFDPPERFVVGTVGPPGQRTFFLQARSGTRMISVAVEKQQAMVLAERIDELLDEVMVNADAETLIPAVAPLGLADSAPLEAPIVEEFRAGTMTLSWESDTSVVAIEVFGIPEPDEEGVFDPEAEPDEMMLVKLPPGLARAFVARARSVVEAGRPDCPFCAQPIDPSGHLCVRANGFKRRDP